MKKYLLLISIAASILVPAATSLAADLDQPLPPPPPPVENLRPATYDWSGAYVGLWGGLACIDGKLHDNTTGTDYLNAGCGVKGGGLVGFNHQFDNVVVGLEGDWGMTSDLVKNVDPTADYTFRLDQIATVRGRAGYAMDDTLFFVTAGGAWARGDINGISSAIPNHLKQNEWGWTVGAGVEHAVTDNFRIRVDYLYTHMRDANYKDTCGAGTCDVDIKWGGEHEVRAALIYAF